VETILALSLFLQGSPRDRLSEAIREANLDAARTALADLAAADGANAARGLILSFPKVRDRIQSLHLGVLRTRSDYDRIETGITITGEEEKQKERDLENALKRVQEASGFAINGEKIYDALRAAFAQLKPEAVPILVAEIEQTKSWILKCELLEGLGTMKAQNALLSLLEKEKEPLYLAVILSGIEGPAAIPYLAHAQWQVRLAALKACARTREAVGPIIQQLEMLDARWRSKAYPVLDAMVGSKLPPDPLAWRDWWKANRDDWTANRYLPERPKVLPSAGRTTFYDVPITSTRICFVIDRSRSMKEQDRFTTAKNELKKLIGELPDDARINVVMFGETASSFSKGTRPLDRRGRSDVKYFIDKADYEEGTNLYLALEKALSFVGSADAGLLKEDGPDSILVLSDGESTCGKVVNEELVARVVARRARYLMPVIHTVSIARQAKSLELMAAMNGGEYRSK
jgi:hypothetical protein